MLLLLSLPGIASSPHVGYLVMFRESLIICLRGLDASILSTDILTSSEDIAFSLSAHDVST